MMSRSDGCAWGSPASGGSLGSPGGSSGGAMVDLIPADDVPADCDARVGPKVDPTRAVVLLHGLDAGLRRPVVARALPGCSPILPRRHAGLSCSSSGGHRAKPCPTPGLLGLELDRTVFGRLDRPPAMVHHALVDGLGYHQGHRGRGCPELLAQRSRVKQTKGEIEVAPTP